MEAREQLLEFRRHKGKGNEPGSEGRRQGKVPICWGRRAHLLGSDAQSL